MSITSEINRISSAKNSIKSSIIAKGVDVPESALIDEYSDLINEISGGGGLTPEYEEFMELAEKQSLTRLTYNAAYTYKIDESTALFSNFYLNYGLWLVKNGNAKRITDATSINKFTRINENKVLCSCSEYGYRTQILVDIQNETSVKIEDGNTWEFCKVVGNRYCVLGTAGTKTGILVVDSELNTFTVLSGTEVTNFQYLQPVGDRYCICSTNQANTVGRGIYLVDCQEKTVTNVYDVAYAWSYFSVINDRYCVCSSTVANSGLVVVDTQESSATQVFSTGSYYAYMYPDNNSKTCYCSNLTAAFGAGLVMVDCEAKTASYAYEDNPVWSYGTKVADRYYVLGSSVNSGSGLLLVDCQTKTTTQIYNAGYYWSNFVVSQDRYVLVSNSSSTTDAGIVLVDTQDGTATQVYTVGTNWKYGFDVGTRYCVLTSSQNSHLGIILVDLQEKTATQAYSSGAQLLYATIIDDRYCVLSGDNSTYSSSIYLVDTQTGIGSRPYYSSSRTGFRFVQGVNDNTMCLCSSSAGASSDWGIILVDLVNSKSSVVYTKRGYWDTYKQVEGGWEITSSMAIDGAKLFFDESTKKVTEL